MAYIGAQRIEGDGVGSTATKPDQDRGNHFESRGNRDNWRDADPLSIRDCRAFTKLMEATGSEELVQST